MTAPLTRPKFLETDPNVILQACIASWETATGKTLFPAQVEQLLLDILAYREATARLDFQIAAEQCLVAWAFGDFLDALAANVGVTRLLDKPATCTLRYTLSATSGTDTPIPITNRVQSSDHKVIFKPNLAGVIPAGQLTVDLPATCQTTGEAGNGYSTGQINDILDPIAGVATAENLAMTLGGVSIETDDALRERVTLAPFARGSAGSKEAYIFWAKSYGPEIIDVQPTTPDGGVVQVTVLTNQGNPTTDQLTAIAAILTGSDVRPMTDTVSVVAPTRLTYTVDCDLTLFNGFDQADVLTAANAAVNAYAATRRSKLGLDVTPSQVLAAILGVPGIYDLTMTQPAAPLAVGALEWADCTGITLSVVGTTDG